ncbi:MAG TPA: glycosyltransferase family 4 protein [Thermoguttaceae bacterium]|nr:glycosyltransferase family 4 protein [Thermoguttaceae bacterium]
MRILWHGPPSDFPTGYGTQTGLFTRALRDLGHDVAISAACYQYITKLNEDGILTFASGPRHWTAGNDHIEGHIREFKPDIVLSIIDVFALDSKKFGAARWFPMVMVDSEPLLPQNAARLKDCERPIAVTQHGLRVMQAAGFDPAYVPLMYDPAVFNVQDRDAAREEMSRAMGIDLTDRFLAVMVAANMSAPSRKNFGAAFSAWSMFVKDHPTALLYVHTEATGKMSTGENLIQAVKGYGIETSVHFPDQYRYNTGGFKEDWLAMLYNAADVYLCTSRGEGFCLPLVEAQACGCPAIATEFGATNELCLAGDAIPGRRWMYHPGTEQCMIDVSKLFGAMHLYLAGDRYPHRDCNSEMVEDYANGNVIRGPLSTFLDSIKPKGKRRHENKAHPQRALAPA